MKFRHCYNAYFRWNARAFQRKVQGFRAVLPEILALEQSHLALKAMAFKACGFVQYALLKVRAVVILFLRQKVLMVPIGMPRVSDIVA